MTIKDDVLDIVSFLIVAGIFVVLVVAFPSFWREGIAQIIVLVIFLVIIGRPVVGFIHEKLRRKDFECEKCGAVYVGRAPPQECERCGWLGIIPREKEDQSTEDRVETEDYGY